MAKTQKDKKTKKVLVAIGAGAYSAILELDSLPKPGMEIKLRPGQVIACWIQPKEGMKLKFLGQEREKIDYRGEKIPHFGVSITMS